METYISTRVKTAVLALLALGVATLLQAQAPTVDSATEYTPEQLDELVAPIAIYPDALIALILPASTAPSDIVLAARYLQANGDPNQINNQPWDDSVKALTNYPDVVEWMNDNLDWTTALGRAFYEQPVQVMESIQQLRALARANGTLVSTPQQDVVLDGNSILIVPATSDAICVPEYDPDVIFAESPIAYTSPIIFFGPPCPVGPWLSFECDWDDFGIWLGTWRPGWAYTREWRQIRTSDRNTRFWRPDNVHQRELIRSAQRPTLTPPHPRPMGRAPTVAQRPAQGNRPAANISSSRPDPRGWRTDSSGHLAVTPVPAKPTGPQIILSTPLTPPAIRPVPMNQPPQINGNRPITPPPLQPNRSIPVQENRPPAPVIHPAPAVPSSPPPSGPLFGGYSRGTDAQNFSNRGQASRAAASPPPISRPAPAPAPRPAPAPEPRSAPPPSGGENNPNQRQR